LAELQAELRASGLRADEEMERLHRILVLSDLRLSSLHAVIQALTLWDFHVFGRLEAWRRRVGPHARAWLEGLAEWEVLAAFGGIAFDQEDWTLPRLEAGASAVTAIALAHPLLPPSRVANDVQLGPPGSFLLVTGSNMSGKSTLLRALGVNLALGQAGAPVAAASLVFPPLTLATSILVEDSLADGASFFWAELQRLKMVVDQAHRGAEEGRPVLYLLDEILRGTNSAERRIAVEKVLGHLVAQGALGAVSTHDLELARLPSLATAARPVFFRETLHPGQDPFMTFDYRLQQGVAPTTNALELLALVGLDPDRLPEADRRPAAR
jgi:DNA mismatch repair ATPase MutS